MKRSDDRTHTLKQPWRRLLDPEVQVRIGSAAVLFTVFVIGFSVIVSAYRAATDSFVAPMMLSPDNDLVIANKQKVIGVETDRGFAEAEIEGIDAELAATEAEEQRLKQVQKLADGDSDALDQQRTLLETILAQKRGTLSKLRAAYESRLVMQADLDRAMQEMNQAEIAMLENQRARMRSEASTNTLQLSADREERQAQLELLKVRAIKKAKKAQREVLAHKVERLRELESQLKDRPLTRAMEGDIDAAFVPYTQIKGVGPGARVYACTWGLFFCSQVGTVRELIKGETTMPDPWGNPARGRFIVMDLTDPSAASKKILRVRGGNSDDAFARAPIPKQQSGHASAE
jgi:hypothetical protein